MGYLIEISEKKVEKLSDHIEQGLHHLGRAMSCVESMMSGEMNHRENEEYGRYGRKDDEMHERYPRWDGGYINYRERDDWDEMNMRRRRDSRGRYM